MYAWRVGAELGLAPLFILVRVAVDERVDAVAADCVPNCTAAVYSRSLLCCRVAVRLVCASLHPLSVHLCVCESVCVVS
jgi:hypothetical protein